MTENLCESISAMMDDEANELEVRRILAHLERSDDADEVRQTWQRYHMAQAVMQRSQEPLNVDISARISAAIELEDPVEVESPVESQVAAQGEPALAAASGATVVEASFAQKLIKPVASLAVAASVAFVVVFGVSNNPGVNNDGFNQQAGVESTAPAPQLVSQPLVAQQAPGAELLAVSADEQLTPAERRLKSLIQQHTEQATLSRGGSFMPHAQAVSHSE